MSKKSKQVGLLAAAVPRTRPIPAKKLEGSLIEHGLLLALMRHMEEEQALASLELLRKAYADWNELRVSQVQEIVRVLRPRVKRVTAEHVAEVGPAANAARDFLQEVFQKTHGLTLEELREDPATAGKLLAQMPYLGSAQGSYLLWVAGDGGLPMHPGLVRVLERLALMTKQGSPKKAREAVTQLLPEGGELEVIRALSEVVDRWCDAKRPLCWECVLVEECAYGKKVRKDWQAQQARAEVQRKREEARRAEQEKRDRTKREREEARDAKKRQAQMQKLERERQKKEREDAKKREREEAAKAREDAKRKQAAEAEKKRADAERKKAEAEKKRLEAERKKAEADKKKAAKAKKPAAKGSSKTSARSAAKAPKRKPTTRKKR